MGTLGHHKVCHLFEVVTVVVGYDLGSVIVPSCTDEQITHLLLDSKSSHAVGTRSPYGDVQSFVFRLCM